MKKAVRKAIIAGNWKMNKTRPEAKELLEAIKPLVALIRKSFYVNKLMLVPHKFYN